jgi:hypothetical protein
MRATAIFVVWNLKFPFGCVALRFDQRVISVHYQIDEPNKGIKGCATSNLITAVAGRKFMTQHHRNSFGILTKIKRSHSHWHAVFKTCSANPTINIHRTDLEPSVERMAQGVEFYSGKTASRNRFCGPVLIRVLGGYVSWSCARAHFETRFGKNKTTVSVLSKY